MWILILRYDQGSSFGADSSGVQLLTVLPSLRPSQSPEEGAVSTIFCAVSEEMEGITGKYVDSNCTVALPAPVARDPALAVKVFEMSKRVISKL